VITQWVLILLQCSTVSEVVIGSFDVDFISNLEDLGRLRFHAHCWDSPSGIKTMRISVGTFPYGEDIWDGAPFGRKSEASLKPLFLPSLDLKPGVQYFVTISVEDTAGWVTRKTSDGFTIDLVSANTFASYFAT
jgi:hypothetical protein